MRKIIIGLVFQVLFFSLAYNQAIKVEIQENQDGSFTLLRGNEPYYIKGAGTTNKALFPELALRGGNSIRTWGIDALTLSMLNEAHKNGLSVILGLWMSKEKDGFDYNDEDRVSAQLEKFRYYVQQFRNHPALLAWSIGNEVEMSYTNYKVWNAVNDISLMIHEEDGNHPTLTITACINTEKANLIAERAPDLDLLGVNAYACISSVDNRIKSSNWDKPYIITEWGVNGPWEVSKTSWGAPLEASSTEKKEKFLQRYQTYIYPNQNIMPGSYAFYWNSKFEATQTWFGLFVNDETTEAVDALEYLWTGSWPENKAPEISSLKINSKTQNQNLVITNMNGNIVNVEASDPEFDDLRYEYLVRPESGDFLLETIPGASFKGIPGIVSEQYSSNCMLNFQQIHDKNNYRLYVLIHDEMQHVATASFPFQTRFNYTGFEENAYNNNGAKVFPNPATNKLNIYIENNKALKNIQVLNNKGMVVLEENAQNLKETNLNISKLPGGFYIVKIIDSDSYISFKKIVKN